MKIFMILFIIIGMVFMGITCDLPWDEEEDDDQDQLMMLLMLSGGGNFFYNAIKEVAPTIGAGTSRNMQRDLSSGTIMYDIYTILRDYEYPTHEGIVDMHNIYKVIYTAGQIYSAAESNCTEISDDTTVNSPYNLGISQTYSCAGNSNTMDDDYANGFAIKESGGVKYGLLTYRWAPDAPSHTEHGILQGSYNESTGDLSIRMIHHVYYASEEGFVVRSHIDGNTQTHAFTISMISSGTGGSPTWISIVGKGISEGSGNSFLFKVSNNTVTDRYFCISSDATETTFEEIHSDAPTGSATVESTSDCYTYLSDVDAMTFLTEGSDVPKSLSTFTGSTILLSGW